MRNGQTLQPTGGLRERGVSSILDGKAFNSLSVFANKKEDNFKRWASGFEDLAAKTWGAQAKLWLAEAASRTSAHTQG